MNKPIIVEVFADNGEHSHFKLINVDNGEVLWEEPETDLQICYKTNESCKFNCSGLCRESC